MTTGAHRERAPRQQVRMALIYDRGDRYCAADMRDISETGLLLKGEDGAAVGKQITLYADLNDHYSWPIHIDGLVVRAASEAGEGAVAVRFLYDSVAQLTQMRLFVQALREAANDDDAPLEPPRKWVEGEPMSAPASAVTPAAARHGRDILAASAITPRTERLALNDVHGILDLGDRFVAGYIMDLSETGFFVATDEDLAEGQALTLIPHGPDDSALPLEMNARVVRTQDMCIERPRGAACTFNLTPSQQAALRAYLDSRPR